MLELSNLFRQKGERSEVMCVSELEGQCLDFAISSGFERYCLSVSRSFKSGLSSFGSQWLSYDLHNGPVDWVAAMNETCVVDPAVHSLRKLRNGTIAWDESFFASHGATSRWRAQAEYGFSSGLTSCVAVCADVLVLLSISKSAGLPALGVLQMCAKKLLKFTQQVAASAAIRLPPGGHSVDNSGEFCRLTPLELQCLQWCINGRELNGAAEVLGISLVDLEQILQGACDKLGCDNFRRAAEKAGRLALVNGPPPEPHDEDLKDLITIPIEQFLMPTT